MRLHVSLSLSLILGVMGSVVPAVAQDIIDLDLGMEDSLTVLSSQDRHLLRLDTFQSRQNRAFGPGERLVYSVRYGIIRAGEATLEVGPPNAVGQRECLPLIGTAVSGDPFSSFFRVDRTADEVRSNAKTSKRCDPTDETMRWCVQCKSRCGNALRLSFSKHNAIRNPTRRYLKVPGI